jgi:hypothetical protein
LSAVIQEGSVNKEMKTVITTDAAKISRLITLFPGPVFDLRPSRDGRLLCIRIGKHVSVLNEQDSSLLRDALTIAKRKRYPLYVIGNEEKWHEILGWADMVEPSGLDKTTSVPEPQGQARCELGIER